MFLVKKKMKRALACLAVMLLVISVCGSFALADDVSESSAYTETSESETSQNGETEETVETSETETDMNMEYLESETNLNSENPETETTAGNEETTETTETETAAAETEISDWTWVDNDKMLVWSDENQRWELALGGLDEDNPLTKDQLLEMLPKAITVQINGETVEIPITWDLSNFNENGIDGELTVLAQLPEGYTLGAEAAILAAVIVVDEPVTLASQQNLAANTVEGVSPQGTTINVFDYWLDSQNADDYSNPENYRNIGINQGEVLKFGTGMGTDTDTAINHLNSSTVNYWTGSAAVRQGILNSLLVNGYPTLSTRLGGDSLSYLFDPSETHAGKAAYTDAQGLLQVDSEGYFYYNSQLNFAEFNKSTHEFTLYNDWAVYAGGNSPDGQFFPFNTGAQVFENSGRLGINQADLNSIGGVETVQSRPGSPFKDAGIDINHYFGMTMSTRFIQQYGGHTDESRKREVTYEFSGDDDVWVYIDDVLVADLGGIHDKSSLTINFSTGTIRIFNDANNDGVYTYGETVYETSNLRAKYRTAGVENQYQWSNNTYADDTYHTLNFFYLERGNTDSNMRLKFNLVTVPESSLIKVDQTGTPIANVVFDLYLANSSYVVTNNTPLATGTTGADGSFIFMDGDQILSLDEIYQDHAQNGTVYLVLREQSAPAGYRNLGDIQFRLESHNDHVIPLSSNQWSSGAYAMANVTVTTNAEIQGVDSNNSATLSDGGRMFAVVLKRISGDSVANSQWGVLTGDVTSGWTVTEVGSGGSAIETILDTVRANSGNYFTFVLDASGAYKTTVSDLPGDVTKYYYMLGDGEKDDTEYTIAYYYTSASSMSGANAGNTWRVDNTNFARVFSTNIYVPNIKNHLLVQKVDDAGKTVDGAVFSLYKASDVEENGKFSAERLAAANAYDTVKTYTGTYTEGQASLSLQGGAVFPSNDTRRILEEGTYYLVETSTPSGYALNSTPVKVIVDDTGIYADAGTADDGVVVFRGVGSIVKSMLQFTNTTLDATLRDIKASMVTGSLGNDGTLTWNQTSGDSDHVIHLVYDSQHNNALEYGSYDENGSITVSTDEGWSKLQIQQCYQHDDTVDTSLKTNLGTADITNLFSGTVTVQVTNERIGTLHISKTVDGDDRPESELSRSFEFTVTLKNSSQQPISGTYTVEKHLADGTADTNLTSLVFNDQGQATVSLADGESIDILGLPAGTSYTVTETAVADYDTSYQADSGEMTEGSTASGTIPQNGSSTAAFTNTYSASGDFSFIKTDSSHEPLAGASFGLYRLICTDDTHDHSQELISVGNDGTLDSDETSCWTLVDTITTGNDGLAEFEDISINGTYRLVEFANPGGYTLPKGQWVVTYTDGAFQVTGSINNPPAFEKIENDAAPYRVINYTPQELPITGNRGIFMFAAIGGGLMGLGALGTSIWYMMRRRRYAYRRHR